MINKIYYLLMVVVFTATSVSAIEFESGSSPQLTFENERKDFGTIYMDTLDFTTPFNIDIKFTNTGDAPLVVSNVRACCGTRVTDWPKEPIMPNGEGIINVSFRLAQRAQRISRTVTVNYNNENQPSIVYRIVGEVVEGTVERNEFIQQRD